MSNRLYIGLDPQLSLPVLALHAMSLRSVDFELWAFPGIEEAWGNEGRGGKLREPMRNHIVS